MIKTTFVTLAKAAERLGSDETELLIACIEERICIYGLVQGDICATPWWSNEQGNWIALSEPARYTKAFAMISGDGAKNMLVCGFSIFGGLLEVDGDGVEWNNDGDMSGDGFLPQRAERHLLFMKSVHLDNWLNFSGVPTSGGRMARVPKDGNRDFRSNRLAFLNQASDKFWGNADKNDPATHPSNAQVKEFLEKNGFSGSLAEKGASIIRPDWAHLGRKPDS